MQYHAAASHAARVAGVAGTQLGGMQKTLVVDDSPTIRRMVIASLRDVCDVREAADAGLTLITALGARPADRGRAIPAIAITTYEHPQVKARVLAAGFHKHLAKPFSPDDLAAVVRNLIRG